MSPLSVKETACRGLGGGHVIDKNDALAVRAVHLTHGRSQAFKRGIVRVVLTAQLRFHTSGRRVLSVCMSRTPFKKGMMKLSTTS